MKGPDAPIVRTLAEPLPPVPGPRLIDEVAVEVKLRLLIV
jgi:hypothetical protein